MDHSRQLDLPTWGGRRRGAGRKPGPHPRVRHSSRPNLSNSFPCHVTVRVRKDVPSLRKQRLVNELERSFGQIKSQRSDFRLCQYSIQRDHVHLLVEARDEGALGRGMKALGARLARAVNRVFRRRGPVVLDRYHLRILETPREVRNALSYVLNNGAKHARKLGIRVSNRVDPASSGRWFDGWVSRKERSRDPCPVAAPRTWLLRSGWRRHRPIEFTDADR